VLRGDIIILTNEKKRESEGNKINAEKIHTAGKTTHLIPTTTSPSHKTETDDT
jgi:lipopolysaccharide export system protein LptA